MTLKGGEAFDLKGIVQGSPNKKERCQEMVEIDAQSLHQLI